LFTENVNNRLNNAHGLTIENIEVTINDINVMKPSLLFFAMLLLFASCKKQTEDLDPVSNKKKGYILVDCKNCLIGYGMPDQYKDFNNSNDTTTKYPYNYEDGYTLQAYITALKAEQRLSISVFDYNNNLVFKGENTQPTTGHWAISILLPTIGTK
jgi:hypothetical protein